MRFGLFWPAYREWVNWRTAFTALQDLKWCMENRHELYPWAASSTNIARVRNSAVKAALEMGFDRILMVDQDNGSHHGSLLSRLSPTMDETGAAAVVAPYLHRGSGDVLVYPWPEDPQEVERQPVWEVEKAGAGLLLLDLHQLKKLEPPWFVDVLNQEGTERVCGEDAFLVRYLREHGMKAVVDARPHTTHSTPFVFEYQGLGE